MSTKIPCIVGSVQTLSFESRPILAQVGISLRRTNNVRVKLTQVAAVGVSFEFISTPTRPMPSKEFHVPIRMVPEIFA